MRTPAVYRTLFRPEGFDGIGGKASGFFRLFRDLMLRGSGCIFVSLLNWRNYRRSDGECQSFHPSGSRTVSERHGNFISDRPAPWLRNDRNDEAIAGVCDLKIYP